MMEQIVHFGFDKYEMIISDFAAQLDFQKALQWKYKLSSHFGLVRGLDKC